MNISERSIQIVWSLAAPVAVSSPLLTTPTMAPDTALDAASKGAAVSGDVSEIQHS